MKHLLLALTLILSFAAQASNSSSLFPIAQIHMGQSIGAYPHQQLVMKKVQLMNDGNVKIFEADMTNTDPEMLEDTLELTKTIKLTLGQYKELESIVQYLSKADITFEYSQIVCQMMPPYGAWANNLEVVRGFNYRSKTFEGKMEVVLNNLGCWNANKIFPKGQYAKNEAQKLKFVLELMAK